MYSAPEGRTALCRVSAEDKVVDWLLWVSEEEWAGGVWRVKRVRRREVVGCGRVVWVVWVFMAEWEVEGWGWREELGCGDSLE